MNNKFMNKLSNEQIKKLEAYMDGILEYNEHINLTAIRDRDSFWIKHIEDSLRCVEIDEFTRAKNVVDLGTGGGFPGIPLAIAAPEKNFILIDTLAKRLKVIDDLAERCGVNNVATLHIRAEDAGMNKEYREQFDLCVSRAVANMSILSEWCLPLVKKGGSFIAYKGSKADEEIKEADKAISVLGGKTENIIRYDLGEEADNHALVIIHKVKNTPRKYPRKPGKAKENPIR